MNKLINIAFCQEDKTLQKEIIVGIVSQGYVPEYYEFMSTKKLLGEIKSRHYDLFILNVDEFLIDEDWIAKLRNLDSETPVILISCDIDEFDISRFIGAGANIVVNPMNLYRIGIVADKLLKMYQLGFSSGKSKEIDLDEESSQTDKIEREIVDLLKSEGELRENHIFLKTILENIPNLIYVKDAKTWKYLYLNQVSERMIGYRPDEMIGKTVFELFHPNYAEYYDAKDKELIRKNIFSETVEEMGLTRENKIKIFLTKKILIKDSSGDPRYFLGISEDLTEHYNAQEELRQSEIRFSKIFHSSPVAIFIISNNQKTFIDVNNKFTEFLGMHREDFIGKKYTDFTNLFDKDIIALVNQAIGDQASFVNRELSITLPNKPKTYLLLSLEQIEHSDDSWSIFIGQDISERKNAEIEISTALDKQKELNKLKTQFISMISHEFRTPLTTIMLSTDLLSRYFDKWDTDERDKHFVRIKDTILKMTQLMENVLIIGRIDSGKFFYNPEEIDFSALCFSIAKNIEFSRGNTHKINIQFNGDCSKVLVDENLLSLIINNLLTNAIKYSPEANKVDFIINCNSHFAEILVRDYGIGIPEEDLQHMFQSFFRASNVGPIPGYGLGLSIVQKCVETHLGKIDIKSNVGEGTTFIVTLPIGKK